MSRYKPYISLRESFASLFRKSKGLSKDFKGADLADVAVKHTMDMPGMSMSLAAGILIDEEDYVRKDARIYFPVNTELLQMLWRAKMDILPEDVGEFPRAFSVAWPEDFELDGVKFHGCLVWFGTERQRMDSHQSFSKKYMGHEKVLAWNPKGVVCAPDERMISMSYNVPGGEFGMLSFRVVAPGHLIRECLKSPDDMEKSIGRLGALFTNDLTPEERRQQFMMLKMVVHLMVYATACPEAVMSGWPDKFNQKDAGKGYTPKFNPVKLLSPVTHRNGSSPCTHWRTWHFRRYPERADGTRRPGVLLVSGCIVSGKVEPRTVLQV